MLYRNTEVLEMSLIVHIKNAATPDWKQNEKYVLNKLIQSGFSNFGVENPVDDLVYIYFYDKNWAVDTELLSETYKKLTEIFEDVKINLYLDGYINEVGNSVDLTLEELFNVLS